MGRESASYFLPIAPELEDPTLFALRDGGAEICASGRTRIDLLIRNEYRYWIDVRLHLGEAPLLEIRIALTNDEWSIRGPMENAFGALPEEVAQQVLLDEDGNAIGAPAERGWSLRLEDDYGRRRAEFVDRVGDVTAAISADHVYLWVHQTRWRRDNDTELQWHREREISKMEQMWDPTESKAKLPPGHPHAPPPEER
ncbi:MAG TPA: hypothetical protein VMY78_03745 [Solirubrobacteraceae bacterium]|nr:hypothetical protein [Solirubrobacteraceae bacterium]